MKIILGSKEAAVSSLLENLRVLLAHLCSKKANM
jgi:hypothetical protein